MICQSKGLPRNHAETRIFHDPLPGTRYQAVRRIGGGATSEVWEATLPDGHRRAVKILRSIHAHDAAAIHRFEEEGRALASIAHPGVVRVLDAGTTAAFRPYFVMPLLEGETLRDRLRRGRLDPSSACAVIADVLDALDAAHAAGVVHRDVKPSNIFLPRPAPPSPAGRAMLLDFGIAKRAAASSRSTGGSVLGTPRYLAPEQILDGRVDARTDVYSAGLVLYEMIAGRGPFDEAEGPIDMMRHHLEARPRDLRELAPISQELAHAVARAIAKSPARRWPSARAFAAVLARAAERERDPSRDNDLATAHDLAPTQETAS